MKITNTQMDMTKQGSSTAGCETGCVCSSTSLRYWLENQQACSRSVFVGTWVRASSRRMVTARLRCRGRCHPGRTSTPRWWRRGSKLDTSQVESVTRRTETVTARSRAEFEFRVLFQMLPCRARLEKRLPSVVRIALFYVSLFSLHTASTHSAAKRRSQTTPTKTLNTFTQHTS